MKNKTTYALLMVAITLTAFFIGRNTAETPDMENYIPISDIAYSSVDEADYIEFHIKDVTYINDDLNNRSYESIVNEVNQY